MKAKTMDYILNHSATKAKVKFIFPFVITPSMSSTADSPNFGNLFVKIYLLSGSEIS